MRHLVRSTRGRLTLVALAVLGVALALADVGVFFALTVVQNDEANAQLTAEAAAVESRLAVVDGRVDYPGKSLPHETPEGVAVDIALVGPHGTLATTPGATLSNSVLGLAQPVIQTRSPIFVDISDQGGGTRRVYVVPVTRFPGQELVLVVSASLDEFQAAVARTMALIAGLSSLVLVSGGAVVYFLVGRALSPVRRIASLADSLGERDLHRRVEVATPDDELGELVETFNRMLGRLQGSFEALQAFTADASHELRSPLAVMATELELSLSRPRSPEEYRRVHELLQGEVQHMTGMVERLLLLARADAGELVARRQELDVTDFLHETAARWLPVAQRHRLHIRVETPTSGTLRADPDLTRRILENVLDNAMRHAPPESVIRISARHTLDRWLFEVADQGPGVPEEERDRLFRRFARGDQARTPDGRSGTGLGLSLGAAFARLQGGDLRVADVPGWGAAFELSLPDAPTEAD